MSFDLRSWQRLRTTAALGKKLSFEDATNTLLIAYADGFPDDEEFIVLYDYYQPVNPSFPYWNFDPFCLDVFDSCECEAHFRVAKDDIPMLLNALRIPASFKCPQVLHVEIVLKTKQSEAETSLVYDVFIRVIKKKARAERVMREKETE